MNSYMWYKNSAYVLGDRTVMYDPGSNMLMLTDATLESGGSAAIFAEKDLTIVLNGENKIICRGQNPPDRLIGFSASRRFV